MNWHGFHDDWRLIISKSIIHESIINFKLKLLEIPSEERPLRIKARHHLREDAAKYILEYMKANFGDSVEADFAGKKLEIAESDEDQDFVLVNGEPLLFAVGDTYFPTIRGALKLHSKKKRVIVDMGAVRFVAKGADIMSPGIVNVDTDIRRDDLVIICDEVHGKALAIGRALVNADAMMGNRGKAIKSIHYIGDRIWKMEV
jgi:PUA domain protein